MRLDKFLKLSRLIKRRPVANKVCSASRVFLNGKPAKAGSRVKINDIIEIDLGLKPVKVKVVKIMDIVSKEEAPTTYEIV